MSDNQSSIPYMYDYQNLILKGVSLITNLIICRHQTIMATDWLTYLNEITCTLVIVDFQGIILWKVKQTCNNISMIDYFLLSSPVFSLVKLFDVLDFNPLFSEVPCSLYFSSHASVNNFKTHSFDNCSKSSAHAK